MFKKLSAVFLALLMIAALVGCGAQRRQPIELTLSTEDAEAILNAAGIYLPDPEAAPGAGTTVKWYSWFDTFHNYSEGEVVNTGFFTFRERYGCDLEYIECTWDERFSRLATLMLGGTPPDFYNGETENFPYYALHGTFAPINDYIDLDDPLWAPCCQDSNNKKSELFSCYRTKKTPHKVNSSLSATVFKFICL